MDDTTPKPDDEATLAAEPAAPKLVAPKGRNPWIAAGVGVGIGSAAIAAAVLYANRNKPKKR